LCSKKTTDGKNSTVRKKTFGCLTIEQRRILTRITIFYTFLITLLSLLPQKTIPEVQITFFDKFLHFFVYFIFTMLLYMCFRGKWGEFFLPLLIPAVYGIILEFLQLLTGYRNFSVDDILFNIFGIFIAGILYIFLILRLDLLEIEIK